MKIFLMLVAIPLLSCAEGINNLKGSYDKKEDPNISGKIVVDVSKSSPGIDKKFYGSHIDAYSEMPSKALINELGLGKIRVGGNEFDVYNYKLNKSINSKGEFINVPGLDSFARTFAGVGVDPVFQINLTGFQPELENGNLVIKRTFDPASAFELIKYLNGTLKLKVVDFSLGNEFSIWNETHAKIWPSEDGISADEYIDRYIQFALAMRRAQEEVSGNANDIKLWGPEISTSWYDWNTSNFSNDCQWTEIKGQINCSFGNAKYTHFLPYFLKRLSLAEANKTLNPKGHKLLDYLSIHYYPNFRTKISDPYSVKTDDSGKQMVSAMLESTRIWNDPTYVNNIDMSSYRNFTPNILGRVKKWIRDGYPNAKLAVNEFAVDSDYRSTGYHPIIRPLYLADSIGILASEGVSFFNNFILSTKKSEQLPWGMIESGTRSHLFYMYKLFASNFLGNKLEVTDNFDDEINSYATLQGNMISLAIVNKTPISKNVQIYLKDSETKKMVTYNVPGWSASVLKLDRNPGPTSRSFDILTYGASEMDIPLDTNYLKRK